LRFVQLGGMEAVNLGFGGAKRVADGGLIVGRGLGLRRDGESRR
jgi:hypothetical protein